MTVVELNKAQGLTRRERIAVLLEFFLDVENSLHDYAPRLESGPPLFGMGPAWNHSSYVQLRRLLPRLAHELPTTYWHLAEMYLRWKPSPPARVAYCGACKNTYPPARIGELHKHGNKTVALLPRIRRLPDPRIRSDKVQVGIEWIDDRWDGGVFLPDVIQEIMGRTEKSA